MREPDRRCSRFAAGDPRAALEWLLATVTRARGADSWMARRITAWLAANQPTK